MLGGDIERHVECCVVCDSKVQVLYGGNDVYDYEVISVLCCVVSDSEVQVLYGGNDVFDYEVISVLCCVVCCTVVMTYLTMK